MPYLPGHFVTGAIPKHTKCKRKQPFLQRNLNWHRTRHMDPCFGFSLLPIVSIATTESNFRYVQGSTIRRLFPSIQQAIVFDVSHTHVGDMVQYLSGSGAIRGERLQCGMLAIKFRLRKIHKNFAIFALFRLHFVSQL